MSQQAKLVYIEWLDHYSDASDGWKTREDVEKALKMTNSTVGWVVFEDKEHIRLAATICDIHDVFSADPNFDGIMSILKSCIVEKKVLNARSGTKRTK